VSPLTTTWLDSAQGGTFNSVPPATWPAGFNRLRAILMSSTSAVIFVIPVDVFLETERVLLRRFTNDDLELIFELDSDPDVLRRR
jgi:hypothetical protein